MEQKMLAEGGGAWRGSEKAFWGGERRQVPLSSKSGEGCAETEKCPSENSLGGGMH